MVYTLWGAGQYALLSWCFICSAGQDLKSMREEKFTNPHKWKKQASISAWTPNTRESRGCESWNLRRPRTPVRGKQCHPRFTSLHSPVSLCGNTVFADVIESRWGHHGLWWALVWRLVSSDQTGWERTRWEQDAGQGTRNRICRLVHMLRTHGGEKTWDGWPSESLKGTSPWTPWSVFWPLELWRMDFCPWRMDVVSHSVCGFAKQPRESTTDAAASLPGRESVYTWGTRLLTNPGNRRRWIQCRPCRSCWNSCQQLNAVWKAFQSYPSVTNRFLTTANKLGDRNCQRSQCGQIPGSPRAEVCSGGEAAKKRGVREPRGLTFLCG